MDEKVKHKLTKYLVDKTKLVLYYEGVNFIQFKIEFPFLSSEVSREYYLKIELEKESWHFGMPSSHQLSAYLETLFRIKDDETKDDIRELYLDRFEERIKKIREILLTH